VRSASAEQGLRLMKAFTQITEPKARDALVEIAERLARAS
jgi:hypothetical protein